MSFITRFLTSRWGPIVTGIIAGVLAPVLVKLGNHRKVIEKILSGEILLIREREVLGIVPFGGAEVTIGRTFELEFSLSI